MGLGLGLGLGLGSGLGLGMGVGLGWGWGQARWAAHQSHCPFSAQSEQPGIAPKAA